MSADALPGVDLLPGDCVAGMNGMPEGSVDAVVTSPPYNFDIRYGAYRDDLPEAAYLDWTEEWTAAVHRVLSPDGSFFLNVGARPSDPAAPLRTLERALRRFRLQNTIHWIKSIHIPRAATGDYGLLAGDLTVGHYKPVNSRRFVNDCHEYIFHLTKAGDVELDRLALGVPYQDKSNVARWGAAGAGVHCRGNTWFLPYKTIRSRKDERPHPATFPAALPAMCLKLHGVSRIRRALDPFLGLGSTALACLELGVPFTGFELDAEYLTEAARRVAAARAAKAQALF